MSNLSFRPDPARWPKRLAPVAVILIAAVAASSPRSWHTLEGAEIWMASGRSVHLLLEVDPSLRTLLDPSSLYIGGDRTRRVYRRPMIGRAQAVATYTSFAELRREQRNGGLPAVRWLMYDPEAWSFTPTREQRRPIHFMKRFSLRARTAGYQVVLAPSPNLTDLARGSCRRRIGESKTSAYVRCRMAARIALYADVLDLQAQGLERAPGRYRSFFATAARQAREANRRISIISQLSSAPADRSVPPVILERAYRAVKGLGDGYYLYVDPMNPSGAARFLEWVSS